MRVLVIGAGGYVASRVIPGLLEDGHVVKAGARDPGKLDDFWWSGDVHRTQLDVSSDESVHAAISEDPALDAVVYLVHGMGGDNFREADLAAARSVRAAIDSSSVETVVYLSGIIPDVPRQGLSEHLISRLEVEEELSKVRCRFVALRAAVILGAASTSFELMMQLAHRLPVTIFPAWLDHLVEPVAVIDVAHALRGAVRSATVSGVYDIGAGESIRYPDLVEKVLDRTGKQRPSFSVPVLPQAWVATVASWLSDIPSSTVSALMESLREDMVARDQRWIADLLPSGHGGTITIDDALQRSITPPNRARAPRDRDPMGALPGDPAWATYGPKD